MLMVTVNVKYILRMFEGETYHIVLYIISCREKDGQSVTTNCSTVSYIYINLICLFYLQTFCMICLVTVKIDKIY